nr:ABC transporter ATP-binding protein [Candidatus Bathyarchaeota archaeon]
MGMGLAAIETFELTKVYSRLVAVDGLNMSVPERVCFGFLGPNGAGKTTTMKMLVGLAPPSDGTATVMGWDIRCEMEKVRDVIGYMPEFTPKPKEKALDHLVTLASFNSLRDRRSLKKQAETLLEEFGLWEVRNKKVSSFSMGMFKKWLLANALMGDPEVIFLDEPTANLDPVARVEILEMIRKLGRERTVFLNSHVLPEVERVADHVAVIHKGRLIAQESIRNLRNLVRRKRYVYAVRSDKDEELAEFLQASKAALEVSFSGDGVRVATKSPKMLWFQLNRAFREIGVIVYEFKELSRSLEDVFMALIEGGGGEHVGSETARNGDVKI